MNIKTASAYIIVIICLILLCGSYFQWKGKINSVKGNTTESTIKRPIKVVPPSTNASKQEEPEFKTSLSMENLLKLTTNQDESVRTTFKNRLEAGENIDFLIVGSEAMNEGNPGYSELLKTALEETYGSFAKVSILSFDGTSAEFIEKLDTDFIDFSIGYDVILYEPLTLNNNGKVTIEDEHLHIKEFRSRLQSTVKDAVVVLQPPHPLPKAVYYPSQVQALQEFAKLEDIPYINHWTTWPDKDSEELPALLDGKSMPNTTGADLWASELITFFTAK